MVVRNVIDVRRGAITLGLGLVVGYTLLHLLGCNTPPPRLSDKEACAWVGTGYTDMRMGTCIRDGIARTCIWRRADGSVTCGVPEYQCAPFKVVNVETVCPSPAPQN